MDCLPPNLIERLDCRQTKELEGMMPQYVGYGKKGKKKDRAKTKPKPKPKKNKK